MTARVFALWIFSMGPLSRNGVELIEFLCMAVGVLSLAVVALGVCLADLWVRFERLLNPCRRMLSEKRIVLPKGGRR